MKELLDVYRFYLEHPAVFVAHVAVLLASLFVLGAAIFAIWQSRIERREEAEREKFERILQASTPNPPRVPGFNSRRVS